MLVVKGYRDRIQRGGGSLVVGASGDITATPASGQSLVVNGPIQINRSNPQLFLNETDQAADNKLWDLLVNGQIFSIRALNDVNTSSASVMTATRSGVGITAVAFPAAVAHTFSGPVKVERGTSGVAVPHFISNMTAAGSSYQYRMQRSGATRLLHGLEANDDTTWWAATGAAGSETYTEALRILNAAPYTGMVSVAQRLGIGTATPAFPIDVATQQGGYSARVLGLTSYQSTANQIALYGEAQATTVNAGYFKQTVASATAPVLVVKLGATPGAGGDALQVQDSSGAVLARFNGVGSLFVKNSFISGVNGTTKFESSDANAAVAIVKGAAGQTANLFEAQDNSGNVQAAFTAGGTLQLFGSAGTGGGTITWTNRGSAPSAAPAAKAHLWYDDTAKAFKYIDSTGTTRTITAA